MLIRELANSTGFTIDTIRFYEKQGLLDDTHFERSSNGYRHYNEQAVQRLKLIGLGQAAGFTLSEMRQSIRAWETDELTPEEKEFHLYRKLEDIERKITSLNEVRDYIIHKIEQMHVEPEAMR
jgi:MerR family transcriptional regulator, copper efflux regulator